VVNIVELETDLPECRSFGTVWIKIYGHVVFRLGGRVVCGK